MLKVKLSFVVFLTTGFLLFSAIPAFAGGYPIYTWSWDNSDAWRPDYKMTYVRVHLAPGVPCVGTTVTFKYEDPKPGDNVSAGGDSGSFTFTEQGYKYSKYNGQNIPDCNTYAKFYSTNNAYKVGIAEFKTQQGQTYKGTFALNFNQPTPGNTSSEEKYPLPWEEDYTKNTPTPTTIPMPGAPTMVYPQDGQQLDLEGAYMFKVNLVAGASGYLFGLFQDGQMVYENYRDTRTLSSNGEFALWENNPFHTKFHTGPLSVWVRALINNQWTEARIITINLRPRGGTNTNVVNTTTSKSPVPEATIVSTPPTIQPTKVVVVTDSSASAALQKRIDELQNRLEESQRKQSVLESQLNQIINWIKSIFPFFN